MQYGFSLKIGMFFFSSLAFFNTSSFASSIADAPISSVVTESKQQNMSPQRALERLKEGNQRFLANKSLTRDYLKQAHLSSFGQFPFAVVLNCMDSRSVPEFFFDQGLADLFTLRVAGNVLNDDILGSMEFATKVMGAKLIVVLGHSACGAMAGACTGEQLGNLTKVLDKIKPVLTENDKKNCKDPKVIDAIAKANALNVVREIQEKSPIIKALMDSKQIAMVAGLHNIRTGEVSFF